MSEPGGDRRIDYVELSVSDIARARDLLGWEPEIDVGEGIRRTIEHYTQILGQPASL